MSQKNKLLKELVRRSLEILAALMAIPNIAVVDERALLKYKFCQNDNYDEKPMEIALLIRLFPRVCAELERDRRFHALCSELDADSRFRKLTMPDGTIIPGTEVLLGNGILISVLWRYLNLTKQLTWNQSAVENLLAESEQSLARGGLRVDLVLPLVGLSGAFAIQRFKLDHGWCLREMTPEECAIFDKHIQPSMKLPCTMAYPGDAPPPFLCYALVRDTWSIPFADLVAPGNVIDPQKLPFDEIEYYLSVLQVSTAQASCAPEHSISSPAIMYRSRDWAVNTFGNPFNLNFSWPLHSNFQSPGYYRGWFAAPGNWNEWVTRTLAFIERTSDDERRRIQLSLRWYAESVRNHHLEDRLIKLMIATDVLFVETGASRGRGAAIGQNMAKWCNPLPEEQRRFRQQIEKIYKHLRNDLIHDGATVEILNRKIQDNKDLADLENVSHCADMFETCFLCAWNGMVVRRTGGKND
ncbi:MAG: hypothetical protein KA099_12760 [Alphaproteobacteria bacterium]|nr:hypothetical protein [Alphaproteobacteria bacterium]